MPAGEYIKAARLRAGLSQRALAARLGVTQPAISALESGREDATVSRLEQILAELHESLLGLPVWAMTAADAATQIRQDLVDSRQDHAMRVVVQLADHLLAVDPATRVGLALQRPAPTGDRRFDALLAATVQLRLDADSLPHPLWIDERHYFLDSEWDLETIPSLQQECRDATPPSLASRNIFLHESFYASV